MEEDEEEVPSTSKMRGEVHPSRGEEGGDEPPTINLDNFCHAAFTSSSYVLTSPRSLRVCSFMAIRVRELQLLTS